MPVVANKTLYLNADRTELVEEDSPDAAFLLARAGTRVDDADAERYGITGEQPATYNAKQDHFEKHGGMDPTADPREIAARGAMLRGEDDPDGPAAPGERGNLSEAEQGDEAPRGDVEQEPGTKALRRKDSK